MAAMSLFAKEIMENYYSWDVDGRKETWEEIADRVVKSVLSVVEDKVDHKTKSQLRQFIKERKFIPGGRYLASAGRDFHMTQNCFMLRAEDSREGWGDLLSKSTTALMSGGGIGVDYSAVREKDAYLKSIGGVAAGPIPLMTAVNEAARAARRGGNGRAALWAGLRWDHPDIFEFITIKNWSEEVKALKQKDFNFPATLDYTNISVILTKDFFDVYADKTCPRHALAQEVYWRTVEQMLKTGEPGFSVNYDNSRESLRNACTELTSEDDSDVCNLGSINLARVKDIPELIRIIYCATAFLLAGTIYSDVPYAKVAEVRAKNRRIGLGLMGLHEWLLKRDCNYEFNKELEGWLQVYVRDTDFYSRLWAQTFGVNTPIKTRAIAPNGTISIIAETTSGIEPIFCVAYKRRFFEKTERKWQYVVDPTTKRLIDAGVSFFRLEDAYSLYGDVERRISFQAHVQKYVDHGISSTINLPAWGSEFNNKGTVKNFGDILMKYLKDLRGITCYPEGARSGQPLTPVSYSEAIENEGVTFDEVYDVCELTKGGSCGS